MEVITRSLSIEIKGKVEGLEPVAIIKLVAERVSLSVPCTCSSVGERNEAFPWNTSTLFFFHKEVNPLCILIHYGLFTLYHFWKIHIDIS